MDEEKSPRNRKQNVQRPIGKRKFGDWSIKDKGGSIERWGWKLNRM